MLPYKKQPDPVLTFLLSEVGTSTNTFLAVFVLCNLIGRLTPTNRQGSSGPLGDIRTHTESQSVASKTTGTYVHKREEAAALSRRLILSLLCPVHQRQVASVHRVLIMKGKHLSLII